MRLHLLYEQTNRALKTRINEHKRTIKNLDKHSKTVQHVEQKNHCPDFNNISIMNKSDNYHQRLFLKHAWYFVRDPNAHKDHTYI